MAASSANFRINQTGHPTQVTGLIGRSRDDIVTGLEIALANESESGVTSYRWRLVQKPNGSTAQLSNPQAASPTFTPDVSGTYLLQLTVNEGRKGQVQRLIAAIREDSVTVGTFTGQLRLPAAGEDEEANWNFDFGDGPIENKTGWWASMNDWLLALYQVISAGGGTQISDIDVSGLTNVQLNVAFNGDTTDASANGYDLQTTPASTFVTIAGKRAMFSRQNTDLRTVLGPGLIPNLVITGALTVQVLVHMSDLVVTGAPDFFAMTGPVGDGNSAENVIYSMRFETGGDMDYFHESASGTNHTRAYEYSPPVGVWSLVQLTRAADGRTLNLYHNGVLIDSTVLATAPNDGSQADFSMQAIRGYLGQVTVQDVELNAAQCLAVAQQVGVA